MTAYVGPGRNGYGKGTKHFTARSVLADMVVTAGASTHDQTDGKHGVAKNIRGAKKFVRSRVRFHENAKTRVLEKEQLANVQDLCMA